MALQRLAQDQNISQPGPNGWNAREVKQVDELLRLRSYPSCAAVAACLRSWRKFAHQGEGYREGPSMPGGKQDLSFNGESWDYPEPAYPPVDAAITGESPAPQESQSRGSGSERTLEERLQLTHSRNPPALADQGFAGNRENME